MKFSLLTLALALGLGSAAPAFADVDPLMTALENLSRRTDIARRTYLATPRKISNYTMGAGLMLMLADTFRAPKNWAAVKKAPRDGAVVFLAGVAAHYAVAALQFMEVPQRLHDPQVVKTTEELGFFFARPLREQYLIAQSHPDLADFVMRPDQAYLFIDAGLPASKPAPEAQIRH